MKSDYQKLKDTEHGSCFIVGSGPSLDNIDAEKTTAGHPVFAINASITLFKTATWIFKNMNARDQALPHINPSWQPKRIFTREANVTRFKAWDGTETIGFNELQGEAYGKHTSATSAAKVALHLGYRTIYLLGMDCRETPGIPYAKALQFQNCIYTTPEKQKIYFDNFILDWKLLKSEFPNADIITMSPDFPVGIFPYKEVKEEFKT